MAFKDSDIARHLSNIGLTTVSVTNYDKLDEQGLRDPKTGKGVRGHRAKLRAERDAAFTLKDVGDRAQNRLGKLRWSR